MWNQPFILPSSPSRTVSPCMPTSSQGCCGRKAHLTSQAGVKLNSWRIVKNSHKAVSHTPITPAQQGHPLITNSRGSSSHISLIFSTYQIFMQFQALLWRQTSGLLFWMPFKRVFWGFFATGKDFISFKLVICISQAKDCSAGMRRLKVTTGTLSLAFSLLYLTSCGTSCLILPRAPGEITPQINQPQTLLSSTTAAPGGGFGCLGWEQEKPSAVSAPVTRSRLIPEQR